MATEPTKRCSVSLLIREMQSKTTVSHMPTIIDIIKMRQQQTGEDVEILEWKMVQAL